MRNANALLARNSSYEPLCISHSLLCTSLASVAGLAPARSNLKGWLLDLLCIHGLKVTIGPRSWYRANVSSSSERR